MKRYNFCKKKKLYSIYVCCYSVQISEQANKNEPAHDKTYNKTCVISKDSDLPVHPPSMARSLVYPSLDNLEAVEGTCNQ